MPEISNANEVFEYRGVDNLVYAKIIEDSKAVFTTGEVKPLAPVATIGKSTETSGESHYYDNLPKINVTAEGTDAVEIICAVPSLETIAELTGKYYDPDTGAMVGTQRITEYFAIGYRTMGTDDKYRYVWRYKGTFDIPEETANTRSADAKTDNCTLKYTGIFTDHEFTNGGAAKDLVVDERKNKVDFSTFFDAVTTPDTLEAKTA